jgi:hypothetical protein
MLNRSWPTADRTLVLPTMALLKGGYEAEEEYVRLDEEEALMSMNLLSGKIYYCA